MKDLQTILDKVQELLQIGNVGRRHPELGVAFAQSQFFAQLTLQLEGIAKTLESIDKKLAASEARETRGLVEMNDVDYK